MLHHILSNQSSADFVEKASQISPKVAAGTGMATAISTYWSIPDLAAVVGIVCSILATGAAITFQYLNYRLNVAKIKGEK